MIENKIETGQVKAEGVSRDSDYNQFYERMVKAMQKIEEDSQKIIKKLNDSNKPNKHAALKLVLTAILTGGAVTIGADTVKVFTEPIYQKIFKPVVNVIVDAYSKNNSSEPKDAPTELAKSLKDFANKSYHSEKSYNSK